MTRRQVYQQSVLQLARRIIDSQRATTLERIDLPDDGDFGFYDPDGVLEWGIEYYMSNHNPGHLPRPGGIMGQTAAVRHDLHILTTLFRWAAGEADAERADQETVDQAMMKDYNA